MPHQKILNALNMTKEQWGGLPPETVSNERNELKKEAMKIIAREEGTKPSLHSDIAELKARISRLENRIVPAPPPPSIPEGGRP